MTIIEAIVAGVLSSMVAVPVLYFLQIAFGPRTERGRSFFDRA